MADSKLPGYQQRAEVGAAPQAANVSILAMNRHGVEIAVVIASCARWPRCTRHADETFLSRCAGRYPRGVW